MADTSSATDTTLAADQSMESDASTLTSVSDVTDIGRRGRDAVYWRPDGDAVFLVDGVLFKVSCFLCVIQRYAHTSRFTAFSSDATALHSRTCSLCRTKATLPFEALKKSQSNCTATRLIVFELYVGHCTLCTSVVYDMHVV